MKLRKFCKCGKKIEREVANEESARELNRLFRIAHRDPGCEPVNQLVYNRVIQRLVFEKNRKHQLENPPFGSKETA